MAWSTPPTWSPGQTIASSNLNIIRDDLLATAAGVATAGARHIVTTGANAVAERVISNAIVAAGETTTSTSFTALTTAGPTVSSITTGTLAIVSVSSQVNNNTGGPSSRHGFDVSGATTTAANDPQSALLQSDGSRDCSQTRVMLVTLTGGSNTFTSKYRVSSGTGRWQDRELVVIAL